MHIKEKIKSVIRWFDDVFHIGKIRAALKEASDELEILRKALNDIAEQLEAAEAQKAKYKKQIKELKDKIKSQGDNQ